jgi:hypothetical protein
MIIMAGQAVSPAAGMRKIKTTRGQMVGTGMMIRDARSMIETVESLEATP